MIGRGIANIKKSSSPADHSLAFHPADEEHLHDSTSRTPVSAKTALDFFRPHYYVMQGSWYSLVVMCESATRTADIGSAPKGKHWPVIFLLSLVVLLPTEYWCANSALETQGEVMQALLCALLWLNVIWLAACVWLPRAALVGALLVALLIVPHQVALLSRLTWLNTAMMQVVDARLRLRAEGKLIPPTLEDFEFPDPNVKRFIYSYRVDEGGKDFCLSYFVVQPGITHSYSSKAGWFYYPD